MLGPIGEKAGNAEGRVGTFGDKLLQNLGLQKEKASHVDGSVEDWAEEANKAQAERHAQEARDREKVMLHSQGSDTYDEKTRPSNDLKPFNSSNLPTIDGNDPSIVNSHSTGSVAYSNALNRNTSTQKRRRRATTRASRREFHASDDIMGKGEAENMMHLVQGHLVLWPYDWLAREEQGGNWLYSIDGLAPLEI